MKIDISGVSSSTTTRARELDTPGPTASLEHRTFVHPVTRGDCVECLPAPCVCGRMLCPDAFEHRRAHAGSEASWREQVTA
jgi:hypothetical protein